MQTNTNTTKAGERTQNTSEINWHMIAVYDNGGRTIDRYTVAYLDIPEGKYVSMLAMNDEPFHPQGFCQHTSGMVGKHLGKRIAFDSLPADCQLAVTQDRGVTAIAA